MLELLANRKKATVKELERLSGFLNFLNKAIVPGRVFTHRMYAKFSGEALRTKSGTKLKHFHHVKLDAEFRRDCDMWKKFLLQQETVNRPFIDLGPKRSATVLNFYSDASASTVKGFGAIYNRSWIFGKWEDQFIQSERPSIQFLELYALCIGVFTWQEELSNQRVAVFCDNKSVVDMVSSTVSGCPFCMELLRMLTINNMFFNRRVFADHVITSKNVLADHLSRLRLNQFFKHAPKDVKPYPEKLPVELWPLSRLWEQFKINLNKA